MPQFDQNIIMVAKTIIGPFLCFIPRAVLVFIKGVVLELKNLDSYIDA